MTAVTTSRWAPRIVLTIEGDRVVIAKPRLAGSRWTQYQDAVGAARFDKASKNHHAAVDRLPEILTRLRSSGFAVELSEEVSRRLAEHEAARWLDREAAEERMRLADEDLRKRGERFREYQRVGVNWLTLRTNALLGDDQGLGKTLSAIAALPNNAPCLVICPALVKGNWAREIKRWRPGLRASVLSGVGKFRWPTPGEAVIVNFDILPRVHGEDCPRKKIVETKCFGCHPTIPGRDMHASTCKAGKVDVWCKQGAPLGKGCHDYPLPPEGTVVIVDEAHLVKNRRTYRGEATRALAHATLGRKGRAWYMTGTPVLNNPLELWSILESADLAHEAFGSFERFVETFKGTVKWVTRFNPKTKREEKRRAGYEWAKDPGPEAADRLARVMLRRMKADVLKDLPPKTKRLFYVEIDDKTLRECDKALEAIGGSDKLGGIDGIEGLLALQKIKFELVAKVRSALANAKIPAMLELVKEHEENQKPLIVFSSHRPPIDLLAKREGWMTITGDTPPAKRTLIVEAFQEGKTLEGGPCFGIAGTISAMGVGVTLTRASDIVFVDREWTPAANSQAEDRPYRHGQKNAVLVTILVANHLLDERVAEILLGKSEIIASTVDAARERPRDA